VTVNAEDPAQPTLQHPRLEVRRVLGSGGMGVVHAAYDPLLEREVAVKVIRVTGATSGARARILREARAIARISHPNVVHVYSADAFDDQVAIVMELVQGQTLRAWLAEKKRTWQEIVAVFVEAGRGLAAAHDAGLVHRDFKPDNVMVRSDGRVCVLDFGLARALETQTADGRIVPLTRENARVISAEATVTLEASAAVDHASPEAAPSRVTVTGALVGTPLYMAPEQHLGTTTDARADQFAFCVALYRALFGQHPFDDTTYAALVKCVVAGGYRDPPTGSDAPVRLVTPIRRGLSPAPEQRFSSIHDLVAALQRATRRTLVSWLAVMAVAVVLVGAALVMGSRTEMSVPLGGLRRAPIPRRLTTSGDINWARVSPDGRWVLLHRAEQLVLVDASGRVPDKVIAQVRIYWCEPSWSFDSRVFAITGDESVTLYTTDSSRPPSVVPVHGCATFVGHDEVASYYLPRGELRFLDVRSNLQRTCQVPGTDAWIYGLDAAPDRDRLLITTYDDVAGRQHLWTMTKQCGDVRLVATLPFPNWDHLSQTRSLIARWSSISDEVLTTVRNHSPPSMSLVSVSLSAKRPPAAVLTTPGIPYFSLSRDGTAYFLQGDISRQIWIKKRSGELARLTRGAEGRYLGSLTSDGTGILLVESTVTGRSLRILPLNEGDATTLSVHDGPALVPTMATMSSDGTIAIIGTQYDVPVLLLRDKQGTVSAPAEAPALGASTASWVGRRLLLNLPGNRNFAVFEDGRRRATDLLKDPSLGFARQAVGAPDGTMVAFSASRRGTGEGIWTVNVVSQQETQVASGLWPIGWSADSAYIYAAREYDLSKVFRVPASGGTPELWVELPEIGGAVQLFVTASGDVVVAYEADRMDAYSVALPPPPTSATPAE
jgi:serine/threonine protein kinase